MVRSIHYGLLLVCIVILSSVELLDAHESYLAALQKPAPAKSLSRSPPIRQRSQTLQDSNTGCRNDYKFDYLLLSLQWGPGFCTTSAERCTSKVGKMFTIHGMWPSFKQWSSSNSPTFCCFDNTFNYDEIKPLKDSLEKYWFSYFDSNSIGFWSHEWLKHGTCARDVKQLRGEKLFFETTLNIVKQLPILDVLKRDGIVPDNYKTYASDAIMTSLRRITNGKRATIRCDLEHHQPTPVLTGIGFCLDKELKFTDCPPSSQRCQRQLVFMS